MTNESSAENNPIRRNLILISTAFLLYFLADGALNSSLVPLGISFPENKHWVLKGAAWMVFGYWFLRYRVHFGTRNDIFKRLLAGSGDSLGFHQNLTKNASMLFKDQQFRWLYEKNRKQEIDLDEVLSRLGEEKTSLFKPAIHMLLPESTEIREQGADQYGNGARRASNRLLGCWHLNVTISKKQDNTRVAIYNQVLVIGLLDHLDFRLRVIRDMARSNHALTDLYFPLVYAQMAGAISLLMAFTG